jgi:hypothetical protein
MLLAAGCGGESNSPASYAGQFSPHGGSPHGAAVSAKTLPRITPDRVAAALVKPVRAEPRAQNRDENRRRPTRAELAAFRRAATEITSPQLVTGAFTGTTDEILQWAARKWRLPVDVVRAVAYVESSWRMSTVGDGGQSLGLMQVKSTVHRGTKPLSRLSSAFNVDYWGAMVRDYMDGRHSWVMDVPHGRNYRAGDLWGAVGAWYAGEWWTPPARRYIAEVKQVMRAKPWRKPGFAER